MDCQQEQDDGQKVASAEPDGLREGLADALAGRPDGLTPLGALRRDGASALLAILLVFLPLYRSRALEDSFNTPKFALLLVMMVVIAVAVLARAGSVAAGLRRFGAAWLLMVLAVWQALSVFWSESKPLGVDGTVYFAAFAILCWLFGRAPLSLAAVRGFFQAGALAAMGTAAWVLYDDFMGGERSIVARLPDWRGNLSAGLGNSGHIAGMVGMFLPWLLLQFLLRRGASVPASATASGADAVGGRALTVDWRSWVLLLGILLAFAAMVVTWSVGSSGATILSLIIWGVVAVRVLGVRAFCGRRLVGVCAAGLVVLGFYFTPNPLNPHQPTIVQQAFSSQRWEDGWPTRVAIWKTTWHIIQANPFFGVGTGNFTYAYTQQIVPSVVSDPVLRPYAGSFTNDAHNDLLQLWAESGIVGLVIWLGALGAFFVMVRNLLAALRRDRRARANGEFEAKTFEVQGPAVLLLGAGAGLTVFVLDGMMSFPMWLPAHFAMAAFFLSVPGVVVRILAQERRAAHAPGSLRGLRARQRSLRLGGVGVLLALAACVWHFSHRVRAEYHLKTGRNMAEANILPTPGGLASPWAVCDSAYRGWLMELAQGQSDSELKALLDQMNVVADVEPMQAAREQFERALAADRWYANASSRLAQLLLFQGHYRQSIEVSGRTLKTLEAYEVHERIGAAAYLAGDHKLARDEWQICGMRRAGVADYYEALIQRTKR